ncbi:MAG: riboflavin synthase [Chloroflexi bacterium]|nr:riboflavin synthase [Chloroflexota bacterium]
MFTGITEEVGRVTSAQPGKITLAADDILPGLAPGESIAVNGVCLTITGLAANSFSVDLMAETVKRSNLGLLRSGDKVNLERPLTLGGRLGGHLVQGHIDASGRVASIRSEAEARLIRFAAPPGVMRYIVEKGFIAVDGVSLTVVSKDASSFQVSVVGYTRQHTTLGAIQVGNPVNLEVDIIAKYVEQFQVGRRGITVDFLQEHGFLVS